MVVEAQARWHCCAAALGDGQLLVARSLGAVHIGHPDPVVRWAEVGGFDENGLPLDTTEPWPPVLSRKKLMNDYEQCLYSDCVSVISCYFHLL